MGIGLAVVVVAVAVVAVAGVFFSVIRLSKKAGPVNTNTRPSTPANKTHPHHYQAHPRPTRHSLALQALAKETPPWQ
jgi:hypothetical protein